MKRVKMMLTAVTIFAVVGGALAFKANKIVHFGTAELVGDECPIFCPNPFNGKIGGSNKVCYRQTVTVTSTTTCTASDVLTRD